MNTYYIKHDNGAFAEVTFSNEMLISMVIEKYLKDAILNATAFINEAIDRKVDKVCDELNIQDKIREHLGTINILDIVDDNVDQAVREYNYDAMVENAADEIDINEMVTEAVQEYLSNTSIQVRIN